MIYNIIRFSKGLSIILILLTMDCASYMPKLDFTDVDVNYNNEITVYIDNKISGLKDTCIGLPEEKATTGSDLKNIIRQCVRATYPKYILVETYPQSINMINSNRILIFKYKDSKFDGSKSDNWVNGNYSYHYQWYSYEITLSLEVIYSDTSENKEIEIYGFAGEFKSKDEAIRKSLSELVEDLLSSLESL